MIHPDIRDSGLGSAFKVSPICDASDPRASLLGRTVRYLPALCRDPEFVTRHGTIILNSTFVIRETQNDYAGEPRVRGYFPGDTFGRVINPEHVEIVG